MKSRDVAPGSYPPSPRHNAYWAITSEAQRCSEGDWHASSWSASRVPSSSVSGQESPRAQAGGIVFAPNRRGGLSFPPTDEDCCDGDGHYEEERSDDQARSCDALAQVELISKYLEGEAYHPNDCERPHEQSEKEHVEARRPRGLRGARWLFRALRARERLGGVASRGTHTRCAPRAP